MPLASLTLKTSYRTGRDHLVRDFFVPCLEEAVLYRRAAGYFTSAGLALAARGVAKLAANGGRMRLIASPHLDAEDAEALSRGLQEPERVLREILFAQLGEIETALQTDRLNALAWMAASGLLEVKLAFCVDAMGRVVRGLYHEKIGLFSDAADAHVAFSGSCNETAGGLVENFESLEVFRSWVEGEEERVRAKFADFMDLWEDRVDGLRVLDFTEVAAGLLEKFRNPARPPQVMALEEEPADYLPARRPTGFAPPPGLGLRDYQTAAIRAWSQKGGRGILAMATGSGKTLTALFLAHRVAEKNRPLVVLVACPFLNLCHQWIEEIARFGARAIPCFDSRQKWEPLLSEGYQRLALGRDAVMVVVTTNTTFQGEPFQKALRPRLEKAHHLLIADEVHNLGARGIQKSLPQEIRLRLGLSATPERHLDPEGTQAVVDYFGDIVFEYPLERAIADGRLCSYRYFPHLVTLTEEEGLQYAELTERIGKLMQGHTQDTELSPGLTALLIKRARLLGSAENKQTVLSEVLDALPEKPHKALFYCGDGRTPDSITAEDTRQIEAVARLLGERHGLRVRTFTYRESPAEREAILRDLRSGLLDGVVAIRCLDEGIDLPDLHMGFLLASSTNPRQFIQRRGRLLRPPRMAGRLWPRRQHRRMVPRLPRRKNPCRPPAE
jgi:superfamily II DNA or RNA helicase